MGHTHGYGGPFLTWHKESLRFVDHMCSCLSQHWNTDLLSLFRVQKIHCICRPGLDVALVLGRCLYWVLWNYLESVSTKFLHESLFQPAFSALNMLPVSRASCSYHPILILRTLPRATFFSSDRFHTAGLLVLWLRQWTVSLCNHLLTEFKFLNYFKGTSSSNCQTDQFWSFTSCIYSWLSSLPPMFVLVTLLRRSSTQPHRRSSSVWRGGSK